MRVDRIKSWLFVITSMLLWSGCRRESPPSSTSSVVVPLKVWVVLKENGEPPGLLNNRGCRLSFSEIQARIGRLHGQAGLFGPNMRFDWPLSTQPTIIRDPNVDLYPVPGRTRPLQEWFESILVDQQNWEPGKINLYFVGNVQESLNEPDGFFAHTLDPSDLVQGGGTEDGSFILFNDGGYQEPFGLVVPIWLFDSLHVIQHEMTHYLARFKNRSFGPGPDRQYDATEHTPPGTNNILRHPTINPQGEQEPYPLVIPGGFDQVGTEKYEIWNRVFNAQWDNQ